MLTCVWINLFIYEIAQSNKCAVNSERVQVSDLSRPQQLSCDDASSPAGGVR